MTALIKKQLTLKSGTKAHASTYYIRPRAYEKPAQKEIHSMCDAGILKKSHWYDDIPWAAASFFSNKKDD